MTELCLPEDLPLTIRSSMEDPPGNSLSGRWTLYFHVPRKAQGRGRVH